MLQLPCKHEQFSTDATIRRVGCVSVYKRNYFAISLQIEVTAYQQVNLSAMSNVGKKNLLASTYALQRLRDVLG